jgi:pimeloyl-ACP methyl ester carboxylesterase
VNGGVRLYFEVHGNCPLSVLLVPPWAITTGALWKMQLSFLARHYATVVYDPRGNGRSDRPEQGYAVTDMAGDALAVLDQLGIPRAGLLTVSAGMRTCAHLAAHHPERISGVAAISGDYYSSAGPSTPEEAESRRRRLIDHFDERIRLFWARNFAEPHSTKAQDDGWEWTHQTTAPVLAAAQAGLWNSDTRVGLGRISCPVLQIHGLQDDDHNQAVAGHRRLAHSVLATIMTPGHLPNVRDPVRVNLMLRDFFDSVDVREAG